MSRISVRGSFLAVLGALAVGAFGIGRLAAGPPPVIRVGYLAQVGSLTARPAAEDCA